MRLISGLVLAALLACGAHLSAQETTAPTVVTSVNPDYTKEAREARIEGVVELGAEVLTDGAVGEVTVLRSLDSVYGLDRAAVAAMKQWKFKPGTIDGKPVVVSVKVEMTFKLR